MAVTMAERDSTPWYRQVWPWALMAGPFAVVIAGGVTAWLAASAPDAMVVDDYYKEGRAINLSLQRDQKALQLGLGAEIQFPGSSGGQVKVTMSSAQAVAWPPAIELLLVHPVRAELDRTVELHATGAQPNAATFVGDVGATEHIAYQITVQDPGKQWRLMSDRRGAARDVVTLRAGVSQQGPVDAPKAANGNVGNPPSNH